MTATWSAVPVEVWAQLAAERRKHPRDRVLSLVMFGKLTPSEAEAWALKNGQPAFATIPDPALFDPMLEAAWTLAMATEWIIRRTPQAVRDRWVDYVDECWDWMPVAHRLPSRRHPGKVLLANGFELKQRTVTTAADVLTRAPRGEAKDAQRELTNALSNGHLIAYAGSEPAAIPAHVWLGVSPFKTPVRRGLHDAVYGEDAGVPRFAGVRVYSATVLQLWPKRQLAIGVAKRGRKAVKRPRVKAQMLEDLRNGLLDRNEKQEVLALRYGAGRETCVLALTDAVSEFALATNADTKEISAG